MRYLFTASLVLAFAFAGCTDTRTVANVSYTATEYQFDGPSDITADVVNLSLTDSGHEAHHVTLARLDDPHTLEEFQSTMASTQGEEPIPWVHWMGGAGPIMPGTHGITHLTLVPGTYVMLCFVPDAQGVPHFMKGMVKQITVHAPSGTAPTEAATDLTLTLSNFAFAFDHAPTAGTHTVRVQNKGTQTHEAVLVHLNPGATPQQFTDSFGPNATGPPPGAFVGGLPQIDPGMHGSFEIDFTPGNYLLLCFVTDPATHAPHFAMGMEKEFTIA